MRRKFHRRHLTESWICDPKEMVKPKKLKVVRNIDYNKLKRIELLRQKQVETHLKAAAKLRITNIKPASQEKCPERHKRKLSFQSELEESDRRRMNVTLRKLEHTGILKRGLMFKMMYILVGPNFFLTVFTQNCKEASSIIII